MSVLVDKFAQVVSANQTSVKGYSTSRSNSDRNGDNARKKMAKGIVKVESDRYQKLKPNE